MTGRGLGASKLDDARMDLAGDFDLTPRSGARLACEGGERTNLAATQAETFEIANGDSGVCLLPWEKTWKNIALIAMPRAFRKPQMRSVASFSSTATMMIWCVAFIVSSSSLALNRDSKSAARLCPFLNPS